MKNNTINTQPSNTSKKNKNIKHRDAIVTSCASIVLPIAIILGAYIIIHGTVSPGGGFQGGVLIAGAVAILYVAFGSKGIKRFFHVERMKASESIGALGFIFIASIGLVYGISGYGFFSNSIYKGTPGAPISGGTIFFMNFAVGYKVLAGIGALILIMVNTLNSNKD